MAEEKHETRTETVIAAATAAVLITIGIAFPLHYSRLPRYGLELPVVSFLIGLAISAATRGRYRRLFEATHPWTFVDASLIILGFTAGFNRLAALNGGAGVVAAVNVVAGLAVGLLLAIRLGLDERFAATFVSGGTICGITAAIATGRAVRAEYPHLLIAMLLIAVIGAPFAFGVEIYAAKAAANVGGALIGAVVDSTPVVRSIANAIGGHTKEIAMAVKLAQNSLIPIVAIALAIIVSRMTGEEPIIPLSLLIMLLGAILATFVPIDPKVHLWWERARTILLGVAMLLAGLATPLEALRKPGVHLAIAVFIVVEVINIVVAMALAPIAIPG